MGIKAIEMRTAAEATNGLTGEEKLRIAA